MGMASKTTYSCDRCEEIINLNSAGVFFWHVRFMARAISQEMCRDNSLELCATCWEEIKKFINSKKKKVVKR